MDQLQVEGLEESQYETKYQRSLRHYLTNEAMPHEHNYRNLEDVHTRKPRPSLGQLHNSTYNAGKAEQGFPFDDEPEKKDSGKVIKFGWIEGVLMRCMLNIWGVMLFLRVSWMVGQGGLIQSLSIVVGANIVTTITALSMSAVATNGQIKGGGVYYMISRSLGPEFGGSIGLIFTIANSIAVATYIIGFINSLQDMMFFYFDVIMIDHGANDIRAIGTGVLVALLILAFVGMEWVTRFQLILWILLIVSQVDIVIGAFLGPMDDDSKAKGFVGFHAELFSTNTFSDYRDGENPIAVFAVFFPAVTGIVAGANLSGDLKDPSTSIPKGTLLAIAITFVTYLIYPFLLASSVVRDASGDVNVLKEFMNSTGFKNGSLTILDSPTFSNTTCSTYGNVVNPINSDVTTCAYGLENSNQVMELIAGWGPLIYAGCFAATLSSAIASLVGAPRILQALAKDGVYPGLGIFSKGYGANNDPVRGYLLVCLISLGCIMVADLNFVSTLLTNFFLASYALINFSCFHASLIKSPGWRPSFRFYNLYVSLLGGFLCLVIMFLIDYKTALGTLVFTFALYLFVSYRKPDVNWGSSTQAMSYVMALKSSLDLQSVEDHVKNYRPQILVLSGSPSSRPTLIDLANSFTKNNSLLICGHVVKKLDGKTRTSLVKQNVAWLEHNKVRAFYSVLEAPDIEQAAVNLFQVSGLGRLRPNMVLLGMKTDWRTCDKSDLIAYFNMLHAAFKMQLGLAILRVNNGLDYSKVDFDHDSCNSTIINDQRGQDNPAFTNTLSVSMHDHGPTDRKVSFARRVSRLNFTSIIDSIIPQMVKEDIKIFKYKKTGTIDVWWMYDDGGLTMLLPHILSLRSNWSRCKLRIFTLVNKKDELDHHQRSMANLLAKFRIDFHDVIPICNVMQSAKESSKIEFHALIDKFITNENTDDGYSITKSELESQKDKINLHIRYKELLREHSMDASLVIMSLPVPRQNHVSAALYMAYLDYISNNMPPVLFVRGNQESVLTYYS